jgi:formyltetrahydrofolate hydrolase
LTTAVLAGCTPFKTTRYEAASGRGQALEGEVLSRAVQLFTNNQLLVKDKKVIFRPGSGVKP